MVSGIKYIANSVQFWVRDPSSKIPIKIIRVPKSNANKVKLNFEAKGFVVL